MKLKNTLALLLLILIFQCQQNTSKIDPELYNKFKLAYIELIQISGSQNLNSDVNVDSTILVLDQIQLTQNDYNRMITYLNEKPERWYEFLQDVLKEIKTDKQEFSLKIDLLSQS